eukprot:755217-Hanusia_phi.AAC.1
MRLRSGRDERWGSLGLLRDADDAIPGQHRLVAHTLAPPHSRHPETAICPGGGKAAAPNDVRESHRFRRDQGGCGKPRPRPVPRRLGYAHLLALLLSLVLPHWLAGLGKLLQINQYNGRDRRRSTHWREGVHDAGEEAAKRASDFDVVTAMQS